MFAAVVKSLRPHQWIKNLFVAAPLIFARRVGDMDAVLLTAAAVAAFCLLSSAVYLLNDLVDIEKDRAHPVKRNRPLASGRLSPNAGRVLALGLAVFGLGAAAAIGVAFFATAVAYLLLNISYSLALKKIAFLDVACISAGFLLRVLGGAAAIAVPASRWLLACTLLLSALLGFGKRAHELRVSGEGGREQRDVLGQYRPEVLSRLLTVLGVSTVAIYALYTQSRHATEMFGTRGLAWTVPFVAFGIFRFLGLSRRRTDAESPTDSMLRDPLFLANLALYAGAIFLILYLAG
jgi:decaprenyl-phosphate phosphoribosyltransferase